MNCRIFFLLLTILFVFAVTPVFGVIKNLGVVGKTYQVVEPDVAVELKQQAAARNRITDNAFLERIKKYQPADLHELPRTAEDRTFLVDMTYTLDRDLIDGDGKVLYPTGYTFNPLDYVSFPGGLMVIDGDDSSQVTWFEKTPYADNHRVRLLLSNGYAFKLIEQLKRPVFYLTGDIARRLQLSAVPSLVMQKDDKLQVREFFVPKEGNDENQ